MPETLPYMIVHDVLSMTWHDSISTDDVFRVQSLCVDALQVALWKYVPHLTLTLALTPTLTLTLTLPLPLTLTLTSC